MKKLELSTVSFPVYLKTPGFPDTFITVDYINNASAMRKYDMFVRDGFKIEPDHRLTMRCWYFPDKLVLETKVYHRNGKLKWSGIVEEESDEKDRMRSVTNAVTRAYRSYKALIEKA